MTIASISNSLAKHIVINNNKDDLELISYGLEGLISSLLNTAIAFLISLVTGNTLELVMLCFIFIPIRIMHKGYHCTTLLSCILYSNIMIIVATSILKIMTFGNWMIIGVIGTVLIQYILSVEKNKLLNIGILLLFFGSMIISKQLACTVLLSVCLNIILILGGKLHGKNDEEIQD